MNALGARGVRDNIQLIYSIVKRNELPDVLNIIYSLNPKAFYTIEDVKTVNEGIFTAETLLGSVF